MGEEAERRLMPERAGDRHMRRRMFLRSIRDRERERHVCDSHMAAAGGKRAALTAPVIMFLPLAISS